MCDALVDVGDGRTGGELPLLKVRAVRPLLRDGNCDGLRLASCGVVYIGNEAPA